MSTRAIATVQIQTENPIEFGWDYVCQWRGKFFHTKKVPMLNKGNCVYELTVEIPSSTKPIGIASEGMKKSDLWYQKFDKRGQP